MGVAVAGGVILGVAGVLLWDELTHEQEQNAPFEVIEIEESHSNVVYAETGVTPEGKDIRVRKLRDNEVRQRGLHQEKAKEGYGATDDIYVDGQDETYIHRRGARDSRGRLILNPFP
ncbi:MAG: hypothetical protein IAE80_24050 [Anaerolinea sp.]|nr:hypothetical protein [Anaerolinea sp.]